MHRIRSIVVPIDFSPLSEAATARAITLAGHDGASIHLVHAVGLPLVAAPYGVTVPASVWEDVQKAARDQLEEVRKRVEARGISVVTAEIPDTNDPVHAIETAAVGRNADLIVMGTHGHGGLKHAFLGSTAERTLRTVDRPVLAVKEDVEAAGQPIARILLAVDFSVHSDRAAEVAGALAKRLGASVDVVHAFDVPPDYMPYTSEAGVKLDEKIQTSAAERLAAIGEQLTASQIPLMTHLRRGRPSLVIAEAAKELRSQLIVMGTRGSNGLEHALLGSVAERTLRRAPCSVLAVKAEEPASEG
jgi:nucleotide-binding universal stress UspA family protein